MRRFKRRVSARRPSPTPTQAPRARLARGRGVTRRRALTTVLFALALAPGGAARITRASASSGASLAHGAHRGARTWLVVTRAQYARPQASQEPRGSELLGVGMLLHPTGEQKSPWLRVYTRRGKGWVNRANVRATEPPLWWARVQARERARDAQRRRTQRPVVVVSPTPAPVVTYDNAAARCATLECAPLAAIHWAARKWSASESALDAVARCESGFNPRAQNPSGSSGLFQFMPATYWAYAPRIGETRSYWSASASANVAAYMFSVGEAGQWVCAHLLGLA